MRRYQLAKLVEWAGKLKSRKRLQKVVYLLGSAGCPHGAEFILHLYGPYSSDLAGLTDEMVAAGLLLESPEQLQSAQQYSYRLADRTTQLIARYEGDTRHAEEVRQMAVHADLAGELLQADLKELEIASTIAYFHDRGAAWDESVDRACAFKKVDRGSPLVARARALAERCAAMRDVAAPAPAPAACGGDN